MGKTVFKYMPRQIDACLPTYTARSGERMPRSIELNSWLGSARPLWFASIRAVWRMEGISNKGQDRSQRPDAVDTVLAD